MDDYPVFTRDTHGRIRPGAAALAWCCSICDIAAGVPTEVKRRHDQDNIGDGYCYACDRLSVFYWAQVGPNSRRLR
jgi:hypothetical protein